MIKFSMLASVTLFLGVSGIANVNAMPDRNNIEVYESWKVAYLPFEHEYWAYTELDAGYTLAYVASKDVVGPGCDMTSIAITSDILKFPRSASPLMITLNYGLNTDRTLNGMLVKRSRQWASLYGVTTIPTNVLPELVRNSYIGSDKTFTLLFQQDNRTVSTGLGRTFGMRNAYQRAIDLCRLDVNRREYPPKMGIK
jgi:hypothetical protein